MPSIASQLLYLDVLEPFSPLQDKITVTRGGGDGVSGSAMGLQWGDQTSDQSLKTVIMVDRVAMRE